MYQRTSVGLDEARRAVDAVLDAAGTDANRPITVTVVDPDGEVVVFARMDGASHLSRRMAERKAYTAARMGTDSGAYGARMRQAGIDLKDLGDPMVTGFGGAMCLRAGEVVVGAVGVSGRSVDEDEALAQLGAATFET